MKPAHIMTLRTSPDMAMLTILFLVIGLQAASQAQSVDDAVAKKDTVKVIDLKKNWPGFRGFRSNGHAKDATPPVTWSVKDDTNILWKTPIAKHGMSSPVVWKKQVFLTGADDESRDVYCFDTESGRLIWKHAVSDLPDSPTAGEKT